MSRVIDLFRNYIDGDDVGVDKDELMETELPEKLEILGNRRRMLIITLLYEEYEPDKIVQVKELSDELVEVVKPYDEKDRSYSELRKALYIGLYQTHLDRLDNHNIIEYDKQRTTVVHAENLETYYRIIKTLQKEI